MKKIVLAGGTGNLGQVVSRSFLEKGCQVAILSRQKQSTEIPNLSFVVWSGKDLGTWTAALEGADVLINMTGESINKRLTAKNKKLLEESRIQPTRVLGEAVATLSNPPRIWINFSGISLFGGLERMHTEDDRVYADDFMANLSKKWEATFWDNTLSATRQVALRLSPVLQPTAGMFKELYSVTKIGLGGKVGSGVQMISWIHEDDLIRIIHWIVTLEDPAPIYHACSPHPVNNADFMYAMRKATGIYIGLPLPTPLAKIGAFVKGVDDSLLLQGNEVVSKRLEEEGFAFDFPTIQGAVDDLVGRVMKS